MLYSLGSCFQVAGGKVDPDIWVATRKATVLLLMEHYDHKLTTSFEQLVVASSSYAPKVMQEKWKVKFVVKSRL